MCVMNRFYAVFLFRILWLQVLRLIWFLIITHAHTHTHIHIWTSGLVQDYPGELVPEPIWILVKQETVSDSGISWAICKSSLCPGQITMPAPH